MVEHWKTDCNLWNLFSYNNNNNNHEWVVEFWNELLIHQIEFMPETAKKKIGNQIWKKEAERKCQSANKQVRYIWTKLAYNGWKKKYRDTLANERKTECNLKYKRWLLLDVVPKKKNGGKFRKKAEIRKNRQTYNDWIDTTILHIEWIRNEWMWIKILEHSFRNPQHYDSSDRAVEVVNISVVTVWSTIIYSFVRFFLDENKIKTV